MASLEPFIDETFSTGRHDSRLGWFNEPPRWGIQSDRLWLEPAAGSDFWRTTHYGFDADNGHLLGCEIAETAGHDWILTTHVRFHPLHQYDQAGLMVRFSADCWLKTSVEYEPDGPCRLGAVVTNGGFSDWSTQDFPADGRSLWLRLRREAGDYLVECSDDGGRWTQLRMARLLEDAPAATGRCGLYACSPRGGGFRAEFELLRLQLGRLKP
jgi:uncharacterized protein